MTRVKTPALCVLACATSCEVVHAAVGVLELDSVARIGDRKKFKLNGSRRRAPNLALYMDRLDARCNKQLYCPMTVTPSNPGRISSTLTMLNISLTFRSDESAGIIRERKSPVAAVSHFRDNLELVYVPPKETEKVSTSNTVGGLASKAMTAAGIMAERELTRWTTIRLRDLTFGMALQK